MTEYQEIVNKFTTKEDFVLEAEFQLRMGYDWGSSFLTYLTDVYSDLFGEYLPIKVDFNN